MKKPSRKNRERQRRLMRYRLRADAVKRRLKLRRRRDQKQTGGSRYDLVAPERFDMAGRYALILLHFIARLKQAAVNRNIARICINFSHTEQMVADGTLYFLANLELLKLRYPNKIFTMHPPSDAVAAQVLHHVGIARILGLRNTPYKELHPTVRDWHKASGYNVNTENAENIFDSFEGKITPELSRSVYKGISEAMTNSCHHAYHETDTPASHHKWWLFSRENKHELHVVFCDLGIGIPKSLYQNSDEVDAGWFPTLRQWMAEHIPVGQKPSDALKIKAAIEIGRSRTKLSNRGKGLQQMVSILDALGNNTAKVTIYSGRGVYHRTPKNIGTPELMHELTHKRKQAGIQGTLISWSIPLQKEETAK